MDEITLDDKTYVSSKRAAQITGYAKDYVGQLCREGRVEARLVGRNWYVLESSIRAHRFGAPASVAGSGKGEVLEAVAAPEPWKPASYVSEVPPVLPTVLPELAPSANTPIYSTPSSVAEVVAEIVAAPTYAPEPGVARTPLEERPGIRVFEENLGTSNIYTAPVAPVEAAPEPVSPVETDVVKEMQSAWHDWFSRTGELAVSKETLLENPEEELALEAPVEEDEEIQYSVPEVTPIQLVQTPIEAPSVSTYEPPSNLASFYDDTESSFDKVTTPITLEKVNEDEHEEKEEEYADPVPLKRSYVSTKEVPFVKESVLKNTVPLKYTREVHHEIPEGRVIRERRVVQKKGAPINALRVFLLALAALAIIVALIGTGKLDTLFSREHINYRPINYLVGQSSVEKGN